MVTFRRLALLLILALGPALIFPEFALAQAPEGSDGIDNDDDGEIDEPDEGVMEGGGRSMDRMEAICNATADLEACLYSHNMFCYYFSLPRSCALAQIGNNCNGGDPNQCRYYEGLMQANVACAVRGDQDACTWLYRQPVIVAFPL